MKINILYISIFKKEGQIMKVLIVVDMQNDFIDGTLGTKEAVAILPNVKDKISQYQQEGLPIIFTRDTHDVNYLESQEGNNLPVEHCLINTEGWEISSELDTRNSLILDKPSFGSLDLALQLQNQYQSEESLMEFELVGLCTDICVISNAIILKAALPEAKIIVDPACCAGVTPESHNNALAAMKMCQITILNERD